MNTTGGGYRVRWLFFFFLLPLGFTLMALTPFVLLDAAGRREAGMMGGSARWYGVAFRAGGAMAAGCFALGYALFGLAPTTGTSPSPTTFAS